MKKFFLVSAMVLTLAGCQTAQDFATSITTASQSINEKVQSVKGYATQLCAFVPTTATVISIFSSGFGTDVAAVANAICSAITTAPLADGPGDHLPRVNGVLVRGHKV